MSEKAKTLEEDQATKDFKTLVADKSVEEVISALNGVKESNKREELAHNALQALSEKVPDLDKKIEVLVKNINSETMRNTLFGEGDNNMRNPLQGMAVLDKITEAFARIEAKEFSDRLNKLIQDGVELEKIEEYFKGKPKLFDINYLGSDPANSNDSPLMNCLIYGASPEIFQFLETNGASISESISARDSRLVPQTKLFENSSEEQRIKKLQNVQENLEYINSKKELITEKKNEMGLLHLSVFYCADKVFEKLIQDPLIDVNAKTGHRQATAGFIALDSNPKNTDRTKFYPTLLSHKKYTVDLPSLKTLVTDKSVEEVISALNGVKKTNIREELAHDALQALSIKVPDLEKKIEVLVKNINSETMSNTLFGDKDNDMRDNLEGMDLLDKVTEAFEAKEHREEKLVNTKIIPAIDQFAKEMINSKPGKSQNTAQEKFCNTIINALESEGYIQAAEKDEIKQTLQVELAKPTQENNQPDPKSKKISGKLEGFKDQVIYQISDLCKKIGAPSLANSLIKKTLSASATDKMHGAENKTMNAIKEALKIKESLVNKVGESLGDRQQSQKRQKTDPSPSR